MARHHNLYRVSVTCMSYLFFGITRRNYFIAESGLAECGLGDIFNLQPSHRHPQHTLPQHHVLQQYCNVAEMRSLRNSKTDVRGSYRTYTTRVLSQRLRTHIHRC